MPSRKYTCTNLANCDKALSKEVIELEDGDDQVCPECKSKVVVATTRNGTPNGTKKKLIFGAVGVLVVGLGTYLLWPSGPTPEQVDPMLTEYYPTLPT